MTIFCYLITLAFLSMSHKQTSKSKQIYANIKEIIKNEKTVLDAMNAIKNELPFMNEEAAYNVIIDLLKYRGDLSDIDSINRETENLMESFEDNEVAQLRETLMFHDEKNENDTHNVLLSAQSFQMDWMKICECISHEMWPKLSSIIKSFIREKNIDIYKIDVDTVKNIIDFL
eukprot:435624_1